MIKKMKL